MKTIRIHQPYSALLFLFVLSLLSCEHKKEFPGVTASLLTNNKEASAQPWTMDDDASDVEFIIKNLGINVNGTFKGLEATILFDDKNLKESSIEGVIDVTTIDTGIAKRDRDLQTKKYFDSGKNREIIFRSESITQTGDSYKAVGTLTIKGTSQKKDIPFTFKQNGSKGIFKSQFIINRGDYGVGGGWPMAKEVTVSLNIVVKKE